MQFKVPPGQLSWVSAIWIFLGGYFSYDKFAAGDSYMGYGALFFAIAGIFVWLDVRLVAWPLIISFGIGIFFAFVILVFRGVALRPILGILFSASIIHELNKWQRDEFE